MNFSSLLKKSASAVVAASLFALAGCNSGSHQTIPIIPSSAPPTISGTITYQDKEYDSSGFTGINPFKAVRYAVVEVIDSSSGKVLDSGTTGADGSYSLSYSGAGLTIYVRILAQAEINGVNLVQVQNLSSATYAVGSASVSTLWGGAKTANISIDLAAHSQVSGAFNILDVLTNGVQFDYAQSGTYPSKVNAYWEQDNCNGTYYCPVGYCSMSDGIYVLNDQSGACGYGGDTDEYDDDVLYHEFGHFTAAHFSQDDSPGGTHMLTSNDIDMRLAWSEGWGDSMPGNIKMWLYKNDPGLLSATGVYPHYLTEYVDTLGNVAGIAIDMDNPDGTYGYPAVYYSYATGEVGVAKILLDSNITFGVDKVWAVLTDFKANPPTTPVNLELFWDRWHSLSNPTTSGSVTIDSIFQDRLVWYSPDAYEPGDNTATGTPTLLVVGGAPTIHTIYPLTYPGSDIDYFSFNADGINQNTIRTSNLINGADTVLTLYDTNGTTVLATNDNANGTVYSGNSTTWPSVPSDAWPVCDSPLLGGVCHDNGSDILKSTITTSTLTTNPLPAGTYYVSVTSSSSRPISAGRYGSYTISITSP